MTNPLHVEPAASDRGATQVIALLDLRTRLDRIGPRRLLAVLDLVALTLVVATYLQLGPPELLFHGVFVVLTIDAFLFGRRVTLERIIASSVGLLGYVALPSIESGVEPLDLTEWPLMFLIAILVAWMADRERTAVRRYARLYRRARDRLVTAQEEERRRLSRDLHDGIGQTLTALVLALDTPPQARDSRSRSRAHELAAAALEEVRSVAERVRPPRLESRGLASALHETAIRCGLPVDLTIDLSVAAELPAPHVIEVYRIAQEAIGNAVRHARASQIEMRLDRAGDALRVTIADDGTGFDATHATLEDQRGLGLAGMRERAALIGARLEILSAPGSGTRIVLLVPLPARAIATVALDPLPHRETRP